VEAYVDDVVIKTENSENFIEDLQLVSIVYGDIDGSLIPKNVSLGCRQESYSDLLSVTGELKLTRIRLRLS
jgi:hypothetical protein